MILQARPHKTPKLIKMAGDRIDMRIDKIKNLLQKYIYEKYGIKAEINPALTLFGIITLSMGKLEVDSNPERWSEKKKNIFADILKEELRISLDEFNKCFKEEINKNTKEQLHSILTKIEELFAEKALIPLKDFEKRTEIKKLLVYKKFIGREEELKELYAFLKNDRKVMFVTGKGGSGKTRLAIEFARQVKNKKWQVYFINHYRSFKYLGINLSGKNILLILDETSRYIERDKVIDFVLNPPLDKNIKLLLLARPMFKDLIESKLRQEYQFSKTFQITKGDIISFLEEYFEMENEIAILIEKSCRDSFVWAAFFAEYYKDRGEIGELKDILIARTEKYIEDIAIRTRLEFAEVRKIIFLISLVTPINWNKDEKYFKKNLSSDKYACLEKVIATASWEQIDILTISTEECSIKPDPVADFLRSEFMKEEWFYSILKKFLPYMPFRISYNFSLIQIFSEETKGVLNLLDVIWKELNVIKGQSLEYFMALAFFIANFSIYSFFDIKKANINQWILCYKKIVKTYPEKEVRKMFASALDNAAQAYGKACDFGKLEDCLAELRGLYERHEDKEVRVELAKALFIGAYAYGNAGDFGKLEDYLAELSKLYKKYPEKEVIELRKILRRYLD